jgi:hypothetical protein
MFEAGTSVYASGTVMSLAGGEPGGMVVDEGGAPDVVDCDEEDDDADADEGLYDSMSALMKITSRASGPLLLLLEDEDDLEDSSFFGCCCCSGLLSSFFGSSSCFFAGSELLGASGVGSSSCDFLTSFSTSASLISLASSATIAIADPTGTPFAPSWIYW